MKVLLVDADSKQGFPNLAIMKISAWLKSQGDTVELVQGIPTTAPLDDFDEVYISCIYFQNQKRVLDYASQFECPVSLGGSGISLGSVLTTDMEHIMPDYSLYNTDFSMGFTSRGCIRNCGFCIVPRKEGRIREHASIAEFLHPDHKKIVLLDNNFQASPLWKEKLQFIIDQGLKVNFNQGLDIRLMTLDFASMLAETSYYSFNFKTRGFHIAFDSLKIERAFWDGVAHLEQAGIPPAHVMVYILVGYDSTFDDDLERVKIVRDLGMKPYIMRYNQVRTPELNRLARWVNRKYYEFIPWNQYSGPTPPAHATGGGNPTTAQEKKYRREGVGH